MHSDYYLRFIEKAQSGHPGMPLGMADIAEVLWRDHLKHSPSNPNWFNETGLFYQTGMAPCVVVQPSTPFWLRTINEDIKNLDNYTKNTDIKNIR